MLRRGGHCRQAPLIVVPAEPRVMEFQHRIERQGRRICRMPRGIELLRKDIPTTVVARMVHIGDTLRVAKLLLDTAAILAADEIVPSQSDRERRDGPKGGIGN